MKSGTSHQHWIGKSPSGEFRKVTVDCPKQPFTNDLVSSMARQAGRTKKQLYQAAGKGKFAKGKKPA